jgi:hypothetical protein
MADQKYKDRNHQFPIHYEGRGLRVFTNPTGELFVEDIASKVTLRMNSTHRPEGLQFTTDAYLDPIHVTNMIGWRASYRD